jgi:cyclic-di-GMP-binding protein
VPSFDIVSTVNMQEVDNAFQQAKKEIDQRYDFKGTDTGVERVQNEKENGIRLKSTTEQRLEAAREITVTKLAKRGVSLRSVRYGKVEQSGKHHLQLITFQSGLEVEKAKALVKLIKDSKIKVQGAIQGDSVRVSGKNRDDLQSAMQLVRGKSEELDVDVGFENFRD